MDKFNIPKEENTAQEDLPTNVKPFILAGFIVIAVTFGGFGTWAAIAEIASAVIAPGTVKVSSDRKKVQSLEGGVVTELRVKNGDRVEAGDILLTLDRTRASASNAIMVGKYNTTRAAVARLYAERDGLDEIIFPNDLNSRKDEITISEILEGQQKLFEARKSSYAGQVSMIGERIGQLKEEINGITAQSEAKIQQKSLIQDELAGLYELLEKGYTSKARVLSLEREASRLEGETGEHISDIARAKRSISEAELEILQIRKTHEEQVVAELQEKEVELLDLEERMSATQYTLDKTDIRATESGYVVGLVFHTIGGVIQPGETVLEIVPENDQLIIEAKLNTIDIDSVHLGLDANIQFTAFSGRTTPQLSGKVIYVSADSLMDNQNIPYYLARINVSEDEVARLGDNVLLPGMPADVLIKTGSRTPLNYFLKPIKESMDKAWREG